MGTSALPDMYVCQKRESRSKILTVIVGFYYDVGIMFCAHYKRFQLKPTIDIR